MSRAKRVAAARIESGSVNLTLPSEYDAILNEYVAERRLLDPMAKRAAAVRELIVDALRRWADSRAARKRRS